jgi:subtilisin-like proprotein convertase family protein
MKRKQLKAIVAGMVLCAGAAMGQVYTFNFTNSVTVPDATVEGVALATNLTGMSGAINNVNVTLNITGGFNGDLYAYLAGPTGGFAVLLNRVGVSNSTSMFGYGNPGFNVTLSDAAANGNIHYYQNVLNPGASQLTGTWQPDGANLDPQSSPSSFFGAPQSALLGSFNGSNPNGVWVLFLADVAAGSQSTVVSWGLAITTTVPEPSALALTGAGLMAFLGYRRLRRS